MGQKERKKKIINCHIDNLAISDWFTKSYFKDLSDCSFIARGKAKGRRKPRKKARKAKGESQGDGKAKGTVLLVASDKDPLIQGNRPLGLSVISFTNWMTYPPQIKVGQTLLILKQGTENPGFGDLKLIDQGTGNTYVTKEQLQNIL